MQFRINFRKQIVNYCFLLLSCVIFALLLMVSRYALPKTDDFANMLMAIQRFQVLPDASRCAWDAMTSIYKNQQGTFFSSFAVYFLFLKIGKDLLKYRYVIMFFALFFCCSIVFVLRVLAKYFKFDFIWGAFLFAVTWIAIDVVGPGESMMYLTGMAVYSLPLALCFFAIGFYALMFFVENRYLRLLFCLLSMGNAFLASGGVLMVSAMINMLMVLLFLYEWFMRRKFPVIGLFPFLSAFGGALINALAPGNFNRFQNANGVAASTPDILNGIIQTFFVTNQELLRIITQTYFLVALIVIAVLILFSKNELEEEDYRIHPLLFCVGGYMLSFIVMFPSALGYQLVPGMYIEERIVFTFSWAATFSLVIAWTHFLFWLKSRHIIEWYRSKAAIAIGCLLLVVCSIANICYLPVVRVESAKPTLTQIVEEVSSNSINDYYVAYFLALAGAEATQPDHPYYVGYTLPGSELFQGSSLSSDPTWWINTSIAQVYQVGLFAYCPDHDFTEQDVLDAGANYQELLP